jgi:rhodanese-related sulfurtransferase
MSTPLRITVDGLKKRMESGEDFTIIDVRKPEAWAESDTMIPESIRVLLDELDQNLGRIPKSRPIVAYCT